MINIAKINKQVRTAVKYLFLIVSYFLTSPKYGMVLRNALIILVRQYNRQKEGVFLCICTYIILMNCWEKNKQLYQSQGRHTHPLTCRIRVTPVNICIDT